MVLLYFLGFISVNDKALFIIFYSAVVDVHTEAVQAALAKHKERKMAVPMPSKRRSLVVQTSMDAYTPPGQ